MQKYGKNMKLTKILLSVIVLLAVSSGVAIGYSYYKKGQEQAPVVQDDKTTDANICNSSDQVDSKQEEPLKNGEGTEVVTETPAAKPSGDYSSLYPNLYVTRPREQVSPKKTAFLTFDDGPSDRTPEVLDILKQNGIKATFFVTGNTSSKAKEFMKRIVAEGHTIAPHTYTHDFKKIYASVESYLEDFNNIYNLIYETTGQEPGIFRFAGGSKNAFNKGNYREIIAEMRRRGFDYFDWNVSAGDAAHKAATPAQTCLVNVVKNTASCNDVVVLMHDAAAKKTTVEALPSIIKELREQGFNFDKLSHDVYPAPYSLIKPYV